MSTLLDTFWFGPIVFSLIVIAVLAGAELLKAKTNLPREITRKFAHVFAGVAMLFMPFFMSTHWQVLALAFSFSGLMFATKRLGLLGGVHGVNRGLSGVMWYPFTGWFLYFIAFDVRDDEWLLFAVPLLVLAAADAFGAIVGTEYGRHRYIVAGDQRRSLEGSAAFFIVAFLCVHIPLSLSDMVSPSASLLIGLVVALFATGTEAISVFGLDNVFVPFATLILLDGALLMTTPELVFNLVLLLSITIGIAVLFLREASSAGGVIFSILTAYLMWIGGGLAWFGPFVGLVLTFLIYETLSPTQREHTKFRHSLATVTAVASVPIGLMVLAAFTERESASDVLYIAYLASLACNGAVLGFILAERPSFRFPALRERMRSRSTWQYTPTIGKTLTALLFGLLPLLLQLGPVFAPDEAPAPLVLGYGYAAGIAGFMIFLSIANLIAARSTCPECGQVQLFGQFCCSSDMPTPRTSIGQVVTFRRTWMLATFSSAVIVFGGALSWPA